MHYAGTLGASFDDAKALGWQVEKGKHNWNELVETVNNHVRMLNFRYRTGLRKGDVEYINALASFVDRNTVTYKLKSKTSEVIKNITAKHIVISVGGRPNIPDNVIGAKEYAISSDDIFTLKNSPGKTLCVGGSYIALECAGFLTELGYDVTVAVRSILLRGFDRQCADKIGSIMENIGTKFIYGSQPTRIIKQSDGRLMVVFEDHTGTEISHIYDTVFYATGRLPDLPGLNLTSAGVVTDSTTGKIPVHQETTNIPNIYAVGDVVEGKQELTPVAIKAGELLAERLFNKSNKQMNYDLVATTVFTPFEYGTIGLSEEEAIAQYGLDDIEVYLSEFTTLELAAVHRQKHSLNGEEDDFGPNCLSKLITVKSLDEKVVGFHFIGPNAGEITQVSEYLNE